MQLSVVGAWAAATAQLRGEFIDELGHSLADWMPVRFGEQLRQLSARISEDLADGVVGVDVSELLIGRAFVGCCRLARGATSPLASRVGGIVKLALEVGELPLKIRIDTSL